ncbi:5-formyltetrahydrofolate cyclo-ligase, mitochondrial [Morella rubra]|uniref:5-formyltetrahydrofolate cyclo-ligase n=1 Tax=Morella rubra TaxID=262757 RepID=A0A6A1VUV1_9ROSI|nr:5-formyltetrahydrofolate cyclo-ligase, mitochondrial [Morella rubra]
MRTAGLTRKVKQVVLVALMNQPCSIPRTVPATKPLLLSRPPSYAPPSAVTFTTMNKNEEKDHLDGVFKQKRALRTRVRKALKAMDSELRSHEDNAIQSNVLESPWFQSSRRLCAYISCSALREVDTSKLLSEILQNPATGDNTQSGKRLYVPRVEDKNSHMRMLNISCIDDLVANSMNILEPAPVDSFGNEREDGLAFDKSGRRIGRGGGYYDTFLKKYQELAKARDWTQPLLVALSYSLQIMDEEVIAVTPNDVSLDALVSPAGVIPISQAALERMKL